MAKIIEIRTRPMEVHESVVEILEGALARAKAGELTSVGICGTTIGGAMTTCFSDSDNLGCLLGAAAMLVHRLSRVGN